MDRLAGRAVLLALAILGFLLPLHAEPERSEKLPAPLQLETVLPMPRIEGPTPEKKDRKGKRARAEEPNKDEKGGQGREGKEEEKERKEPEPEEPEEPGRFPLRTSFDDGVLLSSRDEEFLLRLHLLEQSDYKLFLPTFQQPARSGVYIPRFRVYFEGRVTRSFEYELSLQRSVEGTFDVLDANGNLRFRDEVQLKVGRFLVPYSYDWFDHLEQYFITPERSLFPLNFGLSREAGVMLWGYLNERQVLYAVGGFDGQLTGLADNNNTRDAVGYVNVRPFLHQEDATLLRNLNVGGSVALGKQAVPTRPLPLRTAVQSSENDEAAQGASAIFLNFNDDVLAYGARYSAAAHLAWYVEHTSLEAEYQVGAFPFERPSLGRSVKVPVTGFHVSVATFLTGEVVEKRTTVEPLHPFDPMTGRWGTGAIEPFARYSRLDLSERVFSAGLADPALWSREAQVTDLGVNWYPNRFVKVYFDWQHALFGTPVTLQQDEHRARRDDDLLWVRAQFYY